MKVIQKKTRQLKEKLMKPFAITSVCRADIEQLRREGRLKLTHQKILSISDYEMNRIANKMANAYTGDGFWLHLEIITYEIVKGE